MEELLIRDEILKATVAQGVPTGPSLKLQPDVASTTAEAMAYLQLRFMCELIALACLVAHGDLREASATKLVKEYSADKIIKHLERLHPDFYPKPSRQAAKRDEEGVWRNEWITSDYLTKGELIRLYGECGNFLHRGSLKRLQLESLDSNRTASRRTPSEWADRIWALLEHHQIQTIEPDVQLIGLMKDKVSLRPQFSWWRRRSDGLLRCEGAVARN